MKDDTMVFFPDGELAIRIFIYPNGDALYLFGNGTIQRYGMNFPVADAWRIFK